MAIRRLIVFFDGTWNTPDQGGESTNVVKLLRAVGSRDGDVSQIVFYDKGVGTGGFTDRIVGGVSGKGLTENVVDGYRFLGNNYMPDDEIYIFGFSRGAYTARTLAGFLGLSGLLHPAHLGGGLDSLIEICRDASLDGNAKRQKIAELGLDRFEEVPIKCVGVWDTVGSLGIPGDLGRQIYLRPYFFGDVQLSARIDVALHAIAIDEKRGAFAPTLWVSKTGKPARDDQVVEQVWLPGVHSNIGGSYPDTGLSDLALLWMAQRVERHTDLALDKDYLARVDNSSVDGTGYESRSALYLLSKYYPYQRLINQTVPDGKTFGDWYRRRFKRFDRRNVVPDGLKTINEAVHISALERWNLPGVTHDAKDGNVSHVPYRPINLEAVIRKRNVQVVDERGEYIPRDEVPWPAIELLRPL